MFAGKIQAYCHAALRSQNSLKLTYGLLTRKKFFRVLRPGPRKKDGKGRRIELRNEKQLGKHKHQSWGIWGIVILPDFEAGDRGGELGDRRGCASWPYSCLWHLWLNFWTLDASDDHKANGRTQNVVNCDDLLLFCWCFNLHIFPFVVSN